MNGRPIFPHIEAMRRTAETGAQWAEICRLEAIAISARNWTDFQDAQMEGYGGPYDEWLEQRELEAA